MRLPQGFKAAGATAGIKVSGKPDLALIHADTPLAWALMSTTNLLKAPFIDRNRALFTAGAPVQAVIVNSGNANCATGEVGAKNNERFAQETAGALGLESAAQVLSASTGIIGHQLPMDIIIGALPTLTESLSDDAEAPAKAIMTTDLVMKTAEVTLPGGARVVGIAKGSGMIHPNMATMLAFVMTDAKVTQERLRELWPRVVRRSFNQVTVDGDTSPNDTALVLASGQVAADEGELENALLEVCATLAQKIARDGEGATKLLTVKVTGAATEEDARRAARAVILSPLFKSAAHGNDPNWGRIVSAVGNSGAQADMTKLTVTLQGTKVYDALPLAFDAPAVSKSMNNPDLLLEIDLGLGSEKGTAWGCDLSAEYVRINADYHT